MKPGHMQFILLRSYFFYLLREIYSIRMSASEFGYFEQGGFASKLSLPNLNVRNCLMRIPRNKIECSVIWKVKSDIIQCIHLCFCMLAISFYFVNCVIVSCEL